MLKLTFLGTSAGAPTKDRNVSAMALEFLTVKEQKNAPWLLIDCGDGTLLQLFKTPIRLANLSAILITHLHGDHCFGLANVLNTLQLQGRQKPLTLIAPKALIKLLDTYSLVCGLYFDFLVDFLPIEDYLSSPICLNLGRRQVNIQIVPLSHRVPSYAFLIDSDQTKIVIAGDNDTPALLGEAVKDCQALIHECTYTQKVAEKLIKDGKNPMHTFAAQIGKFANDSAVPMLILTHFSARYASFDRVADQTLNMGHIRAEVRRYYDGGLVLAKDLLVLRFDSANKPSANTFRQASRLL